MSNANERADLAVRIVEDNAQADRSVYVVNQQVVAGSPTLGDVPVVQGDGSLAWGAGGGPSFTPSGICVANQSVAMPDPFLGSDGHIAVPPLWQYVDGERSLSDEAQAAWAWDTPLSSFGDSLTFEPWTDTADYTGAGLAAGGYDVLAHDAGVYAFRVFWAAPVLTRHTGQPQIAAWQCSSREFSFAGGVLADTFGNYVWLTPWLLLHINDDVPLPAPLSWWLDGLGAMNLVGLDSITLSDISLQVLRLS